jgi:non-heme chloroperoxidase
MQQEVPQLRFATTRLASGPQVHYAEQGDPDGEAIVFVHGWPDSWFSFSRVLGLLPPRYHTYAFDQRGFGDSERPACCYGIDDLAADVVAFLDAVDIERATLVGHSLGSFIARRVAETHPERIARLVLIGSAVTAANEVLLEVQASLQTLEDPVPAQFAREFQSSTAYLPLPEAFFEQIVAESLKLPARLWREVLNGVIAFDDAADLGRILAPTLLIWGEQDALFSREEQDRLASAVPTIRLAVYPETGHCPNWERPERVAADLDAFMREG